MCSLPLYQGVEDITRTRPQQGNADYILISFSTNGAVKVILGH